MNQFEARSKAWEAMGNNEDMKIASCVKLCGITWEAKEQRSGSTCGEVSRSDGIRRYCYEVEAVNIGEFEQ